MYTKKINNYNSKETNRTLYWSIHHMKAALKSTIEVLTVDKSLEITDKGFYTVPDLIAYLKSKHKELYYIENQHIVELFFKDYTKKILLDDSGTLIKYREVHYVKPPEILYFGTMEHLINLMSHNGIKSNTKKYIKLFTSANEAIEHASRFKVKDRDSLIALKINTELAFSDGFRFSSFKENEFIVSNIPSKYIITESRELTDPV